MRALIRRIKYKFKNKVWKYQGPAGWYFVTLPAATSSKIRKAHRFSEEGWGRLKAEAQIAKTKWSTAIWYDSKLTRYILPLKATIRKATAIKDGSVITVALFIEKDGYY